MSRRGLAAILACAMIAAAASGACAEKPLDVVVTPGRYGPYYHLRYELRAAAIDFAHSDSASTSGGQFEVRVRPDGFPVAAPKCRGSIILRMPWTAPTDAQASEKIAAKDQLLRRIQALRHDPGGVVPVTLELNPYVEVVARNPLRLRLTQCNAFFRHSHGGYVDALGAAP